MLSVVLETERKCIKLDAACDLGGDHAHNVLVAELVRAEVEVVDALQGERRRGRRG